IFNFKKFFSTEELGIFFILLAAGLSSQRHIPIWAILATFMFAKAFFLFAKEATKKQKTRWRFNRVYVGFLFLVIVLSLYRTSTAFSQAKMINEIGFYPRGAVLFLQKQSLKGEIFALYDWGGYLDWKLPEKKVFVDGRMPSWRWGSALEGE